MCYIVHTFCTLFETIQVHSDLFILFNNLPHKEKLQEQDTRIIQINYLQGKKIYIICT